MAWCSIVGSLRFSGVAAKKDLGYSTSFLIGGELKERARKPMPAFPAH